MQWTTKGQCPRGHTCGLKHDPDNKREPKGKGRGGFPTVQLSTTEFLGKMDPDKKTSFREGKTANILFLIR